MCTRMIHNSGVHHFHTVQGHWNFICMVETCNQADVLKVAWVMAHVIFFNSVWWLSFNSGMLNLYNTYLMYVQVCSTVFDTSDYHGWKLCDQKNTYSIIPRPHPQWEKKSGMHNTPPQPKCFWVLQEVECHVIIAWQCIITPQCMTLWCCDDQHMVWFWLACQKSEIALKNWCGYISPFLSFRVESEVTNIDHRSYNFI